MRFVVDFDRYPRAVCVLVIQYFRGDGIVTIETPCDDSYLRWLHLHGFDVPTWWLAWHSTQAWLTETYGMEVAA